MSSTLLAAIFGFAAAILATLTGFYWNFRNSKSARKLPFLQKQLELCFEASELASRLAVCDEEETWNCSKVRFFELFFGPLAIVEDDDVARAMMRFAMVLEESSSEFPPSEGLEAAALDLAAQIRKLLLKSWEISDLDIVLSAKQE